MAPKSELEESLAREIKEAGLAIPVREYRFHETRKWRLDFAWPEKRLGVEVQGGTYHKGAHSSMYGLARDYEKYNTAALMGWTILQFTGKMIASGNAIKSISKILLER